MSKIFEISEEIESKPEREKYPTLPFVVKTKNDFHLVFKIHENDTCKFKYGYLNLRTGMIYKERYDSLDEMFEDNKEDIIMTSNLKITGKW